MPAGLAFLNRPLARGLALAILAGVLGALLWQSDEGRDPTSSAADLRGPSEPDGFIVTGRFLSFNEQGERTSVINSPRVEQFEQQQLATMISPNATLYDKDSGAPWHITARDGEFLEDEDLINLEGNVVVTRPVAGSGDATLESEQLTLDNARREVYTDQPVVLTDANGVTNAVGMRGWVDERAMELNSQVEGRYETATGTRD